MRILLIATFAAICFTSCSISKKLERSAKEVVLNSEALTTAHVGISVYEPATGKWWYNYQGDKYFVPASNTKIPTCYAAMKYLGDSLVGFRYTWIDSFLRIKATGDPTFLHPQFDSRRALNFLNSSNRLLLSIPDPEFSHWGRGWSAHDYMETYMTERSAFPIYGNIVKVWLERDSIYTQPSYFLGKMNRDYLPADSSFTLRRNLEDNIFVLKSGRQKAAESPFHTVILPNDITNDLPAVEILREELNVRVGSTNSDYLDTSIFHSQPTDSLLRPMMHRSDNFFAEQSLLMVSNERLAHMSDEKIIDTLLKTDFKDLPQKPRWADGSGLSRYNLFTPQDFVFILNKMKNEFGMARIKNIFPTGGEGTISSYYKTDSTFIYAKTGTLSGVVALSGFLQTKKGKDLIFSVLVNNHQSSSTAVRRAVEKFIQGLREQY